MLSLHRWGEYFKDGTIKNREKEGKKNLKNERNILKTNNQRQEKRKVTQTLYKTNPKREKKYDGLHLANSGSSGCDVAGSGRQKSTLARIQLNSYRHLSTPGRASVCGSTEEQPGHVFMSCACSSRVDVPRNERLTRASFLHRGHS